LHSPDAAQPAAVTAHFPSANTHVPLAAQLSARWQSPSDVATHFWPLTPVQRPFALQSWPQRSAYFSAHAGQDTANTARSPSVALRTGVTIDEELGAGAQ
jgi:hypothetical protein